MAASPEDNDDIIAGINVTPLVDVVLVLLIIFIVTASFVLKSKIPINLPSAQTGESTAGGLLNLALTQAGQLYINGESKTLDDIRVAVIDAQARLEAGKSVSAFVSADTQAAYGAFAAVIDRLRLAGVVDIALDTQPPDLADLAREGKPGEPDKP